MVLLAATIRLRAQPTRRLINLFYLTFEVMGCFKLHRCIRTLSNSFGAGGAGTEVYILASGALQPGGLQSGAIDFGARDLLTRLGA